LRRLPLGNEVALGVDGHVLPLAIGERSAAPCSILVELQILNFPEVIRRQLVAGIGFRRRMRRRSEVALPRSRAAARPSVVAEELLGAAAAHPMILVVQSWINSSRDRVDGYIRGLPLLTAAAM
jgi:hypothetical protein